MIEHHGSETESLQNRLAARGYWPARAARAIADGKYSQAVEICREYVPENPGLISGRLMYGRALQSSGQLERAEEQFHFVLAADPDNLVALKCLADIRFAAGDELTAMANYGRILEIDPFCRGLRNELADRSRETTRTISIKRGSEAKKQVDQVTLRALPFVTETVGDLYLAQGHPRLAAEVFRALTINSNDPRLLQKLEQAEGRIKEKGN